MQWSLSAGLLAASFLAPALALPASNGLAAEIKERLAADRPTPVRKPHTKPAPVAAIQDRAASPTVTLSANNSVVGSDDGTVEQFNGIFYADAATGSLRLKPPQKLSRDLGENFDATGAAGACPQMVLSTDNQNLFLDIAGYLLNSDIFQEATGQSEDCLSVSVARPSGTTSNASLPVLFWIYGGAFELGWTSSYDPSDLLSQAIDQGQDFIFVAVNYRVAGFGFMPGKEILADGSANLGLLDQRMGLEWVADNIAAFGGDPTKVTIWGESAGAISVFDQMALYGGDNTYNGQALFRGAIMNSGSIVPADPVDGAKGQDVYDSVVASAGCSAAADTLECLRELDYTAFLNAANSVPSFVSYQAVALSYLPRPDGIVLPDSPDVLASSGRYAAVPMIIGDQEDEGTLFALFTSNVTTDADLLEYFATYYFLDATTEQLQGLLDTYPTSVTEGSPFRTGIFNELYPQYKRIAAVLGDLVFTLTRRGFLTSATAANPGVPAWSYLASYDYGTAYLGTFHGSDILQVFYGLYDNYAARSIRTYYYNFVLNQDPNQGYGDYPDWPEWRDTGSGNQLAWFHANSQELYADDFRNDSFTYIFNNVSAFHI